MNRTPFDVITSTLEQTIPKDIISQLPSKWEKIGEILILRLPDAIHEYHQVIGEAYGTVLNCKTVLNDIGGIEGRYREPQVEILYGSMDTETLHIENGVRYLLDPQHIMFSSGNMDERKRMATIAHEGEVVVDLFAGIGYFTLPMAVYSKPKQIISCEINPLAYDYLQKNIVLNNVNSIVEPVCGDNRKTAPSHVADRVLMGYFPDTIAYIKTALNCLRGEGGIIHFHDLCPREVIPQTVLERIEKHANSDQYSLSLLAYTIVKSYAPGINHIVFDILVERK